MNNQNNINKIIVQLEELWDALPNAIPAEQTIRQDFRTKLEALEQTELKELEALGKLGDTFLQEKSNWLTEKTVLEKAKKDAETALITEKKRLGEELVTKLDSLGLPEEKLTELKTLLASKAEIKLSEEDSKKLAKELQPNNYWGIASAILAGIAVLMTTIRLIFQKQEKVKEPKE